MNNMVTKVSKKFFYNLSNNNEKFTRLITKNEITQIKNSQHTWKNILKLNLLSVDYMDYNADYVECTTIG